MTKQLMMAGQSNPYGDHLYSNDIQGMKLSMIATRPVIILLQVPYTTTTHLIRPHNTCLKSM